MRNTWASFLIGGFAAYYIYDNYEIVLPILFCVLMIGLLMLMIFNKPVDILSIILGLIIFSLLYHQIDSRTAILENSGRLVGCGIISEKQNHRLILRQVHLAESEKSFSFAIYGVEDLEKYSLGQEVEFRGTIKKYRPSLGYLDGDEEKYDLAHGIDARIQGNSFKSTGQINRYYFMTGWIKNKLSDQLDSIFSTNLSTILKSMLLNDLLPEEFRTVYQEAGLIHLFAISGLHMGLWFLVFTEVLKFAPLNYYTKQILIFILLFILLFFLGFPAGAFRVWFMLIFIHIGKLLKYHVSPFHSLFFAASMMLLWRPYSFYNDGFMMSFLAIAGIYGPAKYLQPKLSFLGKYLSMALATSLGVTMCLLPYLVEYQLFLSPWTILLNILLIPVYSVIFIGGTLTLVLSFVSLNAVYFIIALLEGLTSISLRVIHIANRGFLPTYLPVLNNIQKITYYILIYWGIKPKPKFSIRYEKVIMLQFVIAFIFQSLYYWYNRADLKITMPYVDQGDAIIVESGNYRAMIDTGGSHMENYNPTRRYLIPHLNALGITRVDDIFITHGDSDHIGGLDTIRSQIPINNIYTNQSLAPIRDEITYVKELSIIRDNLKIYAIPLPELSPDENDNSMPLLISYGNFKALFMGDLSTKVEKRILNQLPKVTLLKVGHHGSNTSTSEELLRKCQPKIGIISAGYNNTYGHPNEEVMERLSDFGISTFVTQWDGTIEIYIRDDQSIVQTYRQHADHALGIGDLTVFILGGLMTYEMIIYIRRERSAKIESSTEF